MEVAPIKSEGKLHSDPTEKANLLNQQFKSVFVQEDASSKTPKLDILPFPGIDNFSIDTAGIAKLLRTLKCNKALGPDQLLNTYLQATDVETAAIVAAILTNLYEQANFQIMGLLQMSASSLRKVKKPSE